MFIFIVGMPRSGTKLLRDLINNHRLISIPNTETLFYPHFIDKYGKDFPKDRKSKDSLLKDFFNTPFCDFAGDVSRTNEPEFIDMFYDCNSWADFMVIIAKYFGPKKYGDGNTILGDKSPNYVNHIGLLKEIMDNSKFIHIVRDPRDYSISMKRTWNKNIYRAAYRWKQSMEYTARFADDKDFLEVKYECLITNTEEVIKEICNFIAVTYDESMTSLNSPSENYGSAKGLSSIMSSNLDKYKKYLTTKEIEKIEGITQPQISHKGYPVLYAKEIKKISKISLRLWRIADIFNLAVFNIKEFGFTQGIFHFLKHMNLH